MPKYWGKQIFTHGSFPQVGQKQKTERKKEDRKLVITMASYALQTPPRVAHAKPPGPREKRRDRTMVITMAKLRMAVYEMNNNQLSTVPNTIKYSNWSKSFRVTICMKETRKALLFSY